MSERPFERALRWLMLAGVATAAALLFAGLMYALIQGASANNNRLLVVGLIVLMATPLLRVALSCVEASRQRDWLLVWATLAVLVILIAGTLRDAQVISRSP
jgi:hypothetical protein